MLETRSLALVQDGDYELIESAVMESARGRHFLLEYARRNRSADTEMLLGAIGRLENTVARERVSEDVGRMRGDLMEMAQAISRTRSEIAAIQPPDQDHSRLTAASEALDAIVRATETATSDILSAAEEIQEATWTLREAGASATLCDELDRRATQIYTACSFQDLTAQRTSRVVHTLRYLEERISSMIAIWGQRLDEMPPRAPNGAAPRQQDDLSELCQSDVDRVLQTDPSAQARPKPRPVFAVPLDDDIAFVDGEPEAEAAAEASAALDQADPVEDLFVAPEAEAEAVAGPLAVHEAADPVDDLFAAPEAEADPEADAESAADPLAVLEKADLVDDLFATPEAEAEVEVEAEAEAGLPADGETAADADAAIEPKPEAPASKAEATTADEDLALAFGDLDKLSIEEKLALFA